MVVPATLAASVLVLSVLEAELQHHDARRHRGGGRPADRRRDRHGRAHRAPGRRDRRGRRAGGRGRGAAGGARVHAAADRLEPGDPDRVRAARLPLRRDRRVLQGAVGDDGGGAGDLLPDDRLRGAGAGAARRSTSSGGAIPAQSGEGWLGRRHAAAARRSVPAALAAAGRAGAAAGGRLVRLQRRADRLHAGGRRGRLRDGLLHPARHLADRDRPRGRPDRRDAARHAGGADLLAPARHRARRRSRPELPRRLLRPPEARPRALARPT